MFDSVVALVLFEDKILLQLRDETAPQNANRWTVFSGGMKMGEKPLHALQRELLEEIEFVPNDPEYLGSVPKNLISKYHVFVVRGKPNVLKLHEGKAARFFSFDELKGLDIAKYSQKIIDFYLSRKD